MRTIHNEIIGVPHKGSLTIFRIHSRLNTLGFGDLGRAQGLGCRIVRDLQA